MGEMTLIRWGYEIILWVEIHMWSWEWSQLRLRLLVEVSLLLTVHDTPLNIRCPDLSWADCWSNTALWQLNDGFNGTFEFYFVIKMVVSFAVVIMGRAKSHVNAAVTFVLHRIGTDDCAKGGRSLWQLRDRSNDRNRLVIFIFFFLVVTSWCQCRNWVMNNQSGLFVFVIFHVENLDLFLLLLAGALVDRLGWRKGLVVVLDDDLDDWFRCLGIVLVVVFSGR